MLDEKPLSHEERFALMSKRIRTAYKANLGLQLSPTEIQMLGMTSLIDWDDQTNDSGAE
jgi:hypothetical protein